MALEKHVLQAITSSLPDGVELLELKGEPTPGDAIDMLPVRI